MSGIDLSLYPQGAALDDTGRLLVGGCAVRSRRAVRHPGVPDRRGCLAGTGRAYQEAFRSRHPDSLVLFASKSFPAAAVIRVMVEEGCGVDVAAAGELVIAQAAGGIPQDMVLHGNAKTDLDISLAIEAGVSHIVVDNVDDVARIARLASSPVPVLLRVSPAIDAATHEKLSTGHDNSKFGIPTGYVDEVIALIRREPMLDLRGLHAHVGSQILEVDQFEAEVAALARLERFGTYDFGGLGVRYVSSDTAPDIEEYAERLVDAVHRHLGHDVRIMVEPGDGRWWRATASRCTPS